MLPGETITHSSFLPNCSLLESLKEASSNSSLRGWHPHFPLGCHYSSRVSPEALPAQISVLWQVGDASWLLSKARHRKRWRGCIIIFLTIAGAKNSVTIFIWEPNCSQTASDVYSVEKNYPALGLCKSLGKNSQTGYFSSFYFIPFWNMCLDKWQANVKWFGCIVEWYLNISSLSPAVWMHSTCPSSWKLGREPQENSLSWELFISSWCWGVQRPWSHRAFANTLLFGFQILLQTKKQPGSTKW